MYIIDKALKTITKDHNGFENVEKFWSLTDAIRFPLIKPVEQSLKRKEANFVQYLIGTVPSFSPLTNGHSDGESSENNFDQDESGSAITDDSSTFSVSPAQSDAEDVTEPEDNDAEVEDENSLDITMNQTLESIALTPNKSKVNISSIQTGSSKTSTKTGGRRSLSSNVHDGLFSPEDTFRQDKDESISFSDNSRLSNKSIVNNVTDKTTDMSAYNADVSNVDISISSIGIFTNKRPTKVSKVVPIAPFVNNSIGTLLADYASDTNSAINTSAGSEMSLYPNSELNESYKARRVSVASIASSVDNITSIASVSSDRSVSSHVSSALPAGNNKSSRNTSRASTATDSSMNTNKIFKSNKSKLSNQASDSGRNTDQTSPSLDDTLNDSDLTHNTSIHGSDNVDSERSESEKEEDDEEVFIEEDNSSDSETEEEEEEEEPEDFKSEVDTSMSTVSVTSSAPVTPHIHKSRRDVLSNPSSNGSILLSGDSKGTGGSKKSVSFVGDTLSPIFSVDDGPRTIDSNVSILSHRGGVRKRHASIGSIGDASTIAGSPLDLDSNKKSVNTSSRSHTSSRTSSTEKELTIAHLDPDASSTSPSVPHCNDNSRDDDNEYQGGGEGEYDDVDELMEQEHQHEQEQEDDPSQSDSRLVSSSNNSPVETPNTIKRSSFGNLTGSGTSGRTDKPLCGNRKSAPITPDSPFKMSCLDTPSGVPPYKGYEAPDESFRVSDESIEDMDVSFNSNSSNNSSTSFEKSYINPNDKTKTAKAIMYQISRDNPVYIKSKLKRTREAGSHETSDEGDNGDDDSESDAASQYDHGIRRSSRATKGIRFQFWKGERPIYKGGALTEISIAVPTPKKDKVVKKENNNNNKKRSRKNYISDSDGENHSSSSSHRQPNFGGDDDNQDNIDDYTSNEERSAVKIKKLPRIMLPGNTTFVSREHYADVETWNDYEGVVAKDEVISRAEEQIYKELPMSAPRAPGRIVVGQATQTLSAHEYPGEMSSWISGKVRLPARAIKDAEKVGKFNQIFVLAECQDRAVELAIAHPKEDMWMEDTAQRMLLRKGDTFNIPPGNIYRLENHSTAVDAVLYWTIIKPLEPLSLEVQHNLLSEKIRIAQEERDQQEREQMEEHHDYGEREGRNDGNSDDEQQHEEEEEEVDIVAKKGKGKKDSASSGGQNKQKIQEKLKQ